MKRRQNQVVAIECETNDVVLLPIVMAGGSHRETNRIALVENLSQIDGGEWTARIVYSWRSVQHLKRWLAKGNKWGRRK